MAATTISVPAEELQELRDRSDALCRISGLVKSHLSPLAHARARREEDVLREVLREIEGVMPHLFGEGWRG